MARRFAAAIMMCAVMVLVAAVPLALAGTHDIVKGPKGPNASAVTWEYTPADYGVWTGHIVNTGLRWLVVDVYDNTTGLLEQISHQRIRFAAYDAFPNGEVDTWGVIMAKGHVYAITVKPNGPQGSSCIVEDMYKVAMAPVAAFSAIVTHMDVAVDATGSSDADGTIVSYDWTFGDGGVSSGPTATHTYAMPGTYTITLTVTDNDGLTNTASKTVTIMDSPPVAAFTFVVTGDTVNVDATGSTDDYGIVSYSWNWGDGTTGTGPTATHTYSSAAPPVPVSTQSVGRAPPPFPYTVFGFTYAADGVTVLTGCDVTVTNLRTGHVFTTVSDAYGYYTVDVNDLLVPGGGVEIGDPIQVTAVKGTATGTNSKLADDQAYLWIDVILTGGVTPHDYTVTLTVTDTIGQTSSVSKVVTVYY